MQDSNLNRAALNTNGSRINFPKLPSNPLSGRSFDSASCRALLAFISWIIISLPATNWSQDLQDDFFESQIRPLLLEKCVSCHGPEQHESGLRLDSRAAILKGGDHGPAVKTDQPDESLMLKAVGYDVELQMPPDDQLNKDEIAALQKWIRGGLNWPAGAPPLADSMELRITRAKGNHWSFQPLRRPKIPSVKNSDWVANPIDAFVLEQLESRSLAPSPPADDYTIVRRLFFDLVGLPPTIDDIAKFQNASKLNRVSTLVDDLLSRPQYGERWGRHWLDVARYADTQGYAFAKDRRYPHAYTYRDYVIDAFNNDLPYDQFVLQQLAADQLELGEDTTPLAALGFLTVGRKFINHHDTLDDQIDVVTRGLMGLTVSCARCHDHKFDPITTADYYSLYGIFASCDQPNIKPPIGKLADVEKMKRFDEQLSHYQTALDSFRNEHVNRQKQLTLDNLHDYFYAAIKTETDPPTSSTGTDLHPKMLGRWKKKLQEYANLPAFKPWTVINQLPNEQFVELVKEKFQAIRAAEQTFTSNPANSTSTPALFRIDIPSRLEQSGIQSKQDVAKVYSDLARETWDEFNRLGGNDDAVIKIAPELRPFIKLFRNEDSPLNIPANEIRDYLEPKHVVELQNLEQQLNDWKSKSPPPLPRAMVLVDKPQPIEPHIFVRGNHNSLGPKVPRQFISIFADGQPSPFAANASGRLELAREIVSDKNPLTARVIANRVWMFHFGKPLVNTPSDFGLRSEKPVHHELLDYLAHYLRTNNWSIKSLHRLILNSQTWQQASWDRTEGRAIDPENKYYWRANRRRLEWEAIRDSLYLVAGELDLTTGGPSIDMFRDKLSNRRSIYGSIDRQDLPNLLRSFDFPNPDQSVAKRVNTTVPQQALFMMNGTMVSSLSSAICQNEQLTKLENDQDKINWLYERIFARSATIQESDLAIKYLNSGDNAENELRLQNLVQALLMSNEFSFID